MGAKQGLSPTLHTLTHSYSRKKVFVVPVGNHSNIPFSRVNHSKFMVTDKAAYIGESLGWSTGGQRAGQERCTRVFWGSHISPACQLRLVGSRLPYMSGCPGCSLTTPSSHSVGQAAGDVGSGSSVSPSRYL